MTNLPWYRIVNLSFEISASAVSFIAILCIMTSGRDKRRNDRRFLNLLTYNMGAMLMDALALYFRGREGSIAWFGVRASNYIQFVFGLGLSMTFLLYQIAYLERKTEQPIPKNYRRIAIGVSAVSFLLLTVNLFYPIMYQIDSANYYSRLPAYPLIFLSSFTLMILSTSMLIRYHKVFQVKETITFAFFVVVPFIALIFSAKYYGLVFGYFGTTIAFVAMFVFLQSEQGRQIAEQEKKVAEQEKELLQSRVDIMLSQIQPHFLYNSLNTIAAICEKNPHLASEAATNFSDYLRANLNSLKKKTPVLFPEELSHVKNYLWLEELRFDDDLQVSYDIETTDIRLPILTMQPIVENSVKHGLMGRNGVCHIRISTRKYEDYSEIIIEDDGVGFDVNAVQAKTPDGKAHIGIENVRKRLKTMVDGTMIVESKPGRGTRTTIRVPEVY